MIKRSWIAIIALGAGLGAAVSGQPYPPQQYPQQQSGGYSGDPNYNGGGQYDPYYGADPAYGGYPQGVYAPAPPPPPAPVAVYRRPPMPGPGFYWVDGYWNWTAGRYAWIPGYWMRPPYAGAYWVAPRYTGNRYFVGFWARPRIDRGYRYGYRDDHRYYSRGYRR